jgi:3-methyl-2-oxobutanoate hydroxymethyltransferase
MPKITLSALQKLKSEGKRFSVLTTYDSTFSQIISEAGIDVLLVGDSLGMVVQGRDSTVPVTMDDMLYHTRAVANGNKNSLIMADLPFMSYATEESALTNAASLMQAGAHIIKLEGGRWLNQTLSRLTKTGIPVCAHIGLTPQSVNKLGGYKIQGRDQQGAQNLIDDAIALEQAGADMLLMECIPSALATRITQQVSIPTIGIGAGPGTDAQVLVLHDMLGIATDYSPKFVKNFLDDANSIQEAIIAYDQAVKSGSFPGPEHCY